MRITRLPGLARSFTSFKWVGLARTGLSPCRGVEAFRQHRCGLAGDGGSLSRGISGAAGNGIVGPVGRGRRDLCRILLDLRLVRWPGGLGLADLRTGTGFGPAQRGSAHRGNRLALPPAPRARFFIREHPEFPKLSHPNPLAEQMPKKPLLVPPAILVPKTHRFQSLAKNPTTNPAGMDPRAGRRQEEGRPPPFAGRDVRHPQARAPSPELAGCFGDLNTKRGDGPCVVRGALSGSSGW